MANFPQANLPKVPSSAPSSDTNSGATLSKTASYATIAAVPLAVIAIFAATYTPQFKLCVEHPGTSTCLHLADLGPADAAGPDMLGPDQTPQLTISPIYFDTVAEAWVSESPAEDDSSQVQAFQVTSLRPELQNSADQLSALIKGAALRSGVSEFLKGCGRRRATDNKATDTPGAEDEAPADAASPDSAADASDSVHSVTTIKRKSGNLVSVYIETRWSCTASSGLESEGHRAVVVNFDLLSGKPLERAKVSLHAQILQVCGSDTTYYLTDRGFQCLRTFSSEQLKPPEEVGHVDYDNEQIQKAAGPDLSAWLKHSLTPPQLNSNRP